MEISITVILMGTLMNGVASMTHSLMEFWTYSSEVPNFPTFITVGVLNGHTVYYYDSKTKKTVLKQRWMNRVIEEEPGILEWKTHKNIYREQVEKDNFETFKLSFNHTEGIHIWQRMAGCEWDDETDEIKGYHQSALDGEDFLSMDWETLTFIAAKPQAFATKLKWERNGLAYYLKNEVNHLCEHYLKKLVRFGEKAIKRKELPLVSFLQKSSSSPVTCHATGFYPNKAMLFWAKDGKELDEDPGEILPNHDGTFQSSVSLDLSSVPTEDWGRYSCVFQLSGVPDDLITKLDPCKIRTNEKKQNSFMIIVAVVSALGLAVLAAGIYYYRSRCINNLV